jgi:hypothetical protein
VRPQGTRLPRRGWWRWVSRLRRGLATGRRGWAGGPPWAWGLVPRGRAMWAGFGCLPTRLATAALLVGASLEPVGSLWPGTGQRSTRSPGGGPGRRGRGFRICSAMPHRRHFHDPEALSCPPSTGLQDHGNGGCGGDFGFATPCPTGTTSMILATLPHSARFGARIVPGWPCGSEDMPVAAGGESARAGQPRSGAPVGWWVSTSLRLGKMEG